MRIKSWTGLGGSTRRLHQKEIIVEIKKMGHDNEEPYSPNDKQVDV